MNFNNVNIDVSGGQSIIKALQNYNTIILKPNIVDNRNVLTQKMMSEKHTKYIIRWNYSLEGATINVPEDCIIEFAGGTIDNGTIVGDNTIMIYSKPIDEVCPAERQGTFIYNTTVADEEDITSESGQLKFKDRPATDGMGRKILRKNIVNGVNTLTQSMINQPNTIYVIQYDFTLGEDITVPANCVLEFNGGGISGSNTLTYTNTLITGSWEKSISCVCAGTIANDIVNPLMYGAHINSATLNSSTAIQAAINNNKKVEFTKGTYIIDAPIVLDGNYYNIDFSFSTLKKTSSTTYNYTYKDVEYQDAAVIVYKPSSGYTSGYSILSNLIIDGVNKTNNVTGIIARNNRAITLNDIRINSCKTGFIFGGFLNIYNKLTCNDCELGFDLSNLIYSVFTECFNSVPNSDGRGYIINNCLNIEFNSCSSDNSTNAAYYVMDSKISLINCSCEVKTLCIFGRNSIIAIIGGHFECYQYSSPNPVRYIQLAASKLYAKGTFFHWANYGTLTTYADSIQIAATNGSLVDIEGTIEYIEGLKILSYSADSIYINNVKAPHVSPITLPIKTIGSTEYRPTLIDSDEGFEYYDVTLRKNIKWSGNRWEDENGFPAVPTVGTTENRPTGIGAGGVLDNNKDKGFCYFDTDLKKPIYATRIYDNGTVGWVDALGNSINNVYPRVIGTPTNNNLAKFNIDTYGNIGVEDAGVAPQV